MALEHLDAAVTNAAKHAKPTRIEVHVGRRNGSVFVKVRDDGWGVRPSTAAAASVA